MTKHTLFKKWSFHCKCAKGAFEFVIWTLLSRSKMRIKPGAATQFAYCTPSCKNEKVCSLGSSAAGSFLKQDLFYPSNSAVSLSSVQERQQKTLQGSAPGDEGLGQPKPLLLPAFEGEQSKGWEQKGILRVCRCCTGASPARLLLERREGNRYFRVQFVFAISGIYLRMDKPCAGAYLSLCCLERKRWTVLLRGHLHLLGLIPLAVIMAPDLLLWRTVPL